MTGHILYAPNLDWPDLVGVSLRIEAMLSMMRFMPESIDPTPYKDTATVQSHPILAIRRIDPDTGCELVSILNKRHEGFAGNNVEHRLRKHPKLLLSVLKEPLHLDGSNIPGTGDGDALEWMSELCSLAKDLSQEAGALSLIDRYDAGFKPAARDVLAGIVGHVGAALVPRFANNNRPQIIVIPPSPYGPLKVKMALQGDDDDGRDCVVQSHLDAWANALPSVIELDVDNRNEERTISLQPHRIRAGTAEPCDDPIALMRLHKLLPAPDGPAVTSQSLGLTA